MNPNIMKTKEMAPRVGLELPRNLLIQRALFRHPGKLPLKLPSKSRAPMRPA